MSDGLAMFNPEGRLVFCNDQYRAAFPRSAYARQPGAHITDIVRAVVRNAERSDVGPDVSEEWMQESAAQLFVTRDTEIPLFDGRWLSLRTRLASDGSALVVVSDITSMKRSEEELKQFAVEMKGLAYADSLTGIANRRVFDQAISEEFARACRNGSPLSLLLCDVDHFKAFNDMVTKRETIASRRSARLSDRSSDGSPTSLPLWWRRIRNLTPRNGRGWCSAPCRGAALVVAWACNTAQSEQPVDRDGQHRSGKHVDCINICRSCRVDRGCGPGAVRRQDQGS